MLVRKGMKVIALDYGDNGRVAAVDRKRNLVVVEFTNEVGQTAYYEMPVQMLLHALTKQPLVLRPRKMLHYMYVCLGLGLALFFAADVILKNIFQFPAVGVVLQELWITANQAWHANLKTSFPLYKALSYALSGVPLTYMGWYALRTAKDDKEAMGWRRGKAASRYAEMDNQKNESPQQDQSGGNASSNTEREEPVRPAPESPLQGDYDVLGLDVGASLEDVRSKYRELVKQYHPDVVSRLDLSDEQKALFNEKFAVIHDAYSKIKEALS